jgi:protein-tyrosine-phosphatase
MSKSVLFVCQRNSGRSPACELLARYEAWRAGLNFSISSAGCGAIDNEEEGGEIGVWPVEVQMGAGPNPFFSSAMRPMGLETPFRQHRRRMVRSSHSLSVGYDHYLIVAMTKEIANWLIADGAPQKRVIVANNGAGIPDPVGPEDLEPTVSLCHRAAIEALKLADERHRQAKAAFSHPRPAPASHVS